MQFAPLCEQALYHVGGKQSASIAAWTSQRCPMDDGGRPLRRANAGNAFSSLHIQLIERTASREKNSDPLASPIATPMIAAGQQTSERGSRRRAGTGKTNYPFRSGHLDAIGYRGWIGCEYKPRTTTVDVLGWLAALTLDT